ncbi:uncharacterized protein LOC120068128 [Benincasa hispida]|uniref:uncharacterized protein LOC120068128 n=1 Tax=Benincasa hispida TaxID=102211 RepID=UPI0019027EF6|nr:uncharacterized protein LOC120068128 [Benincasa hispida]
MFTIDVGTVYDLRLALLPIATLCETADIKCTNQRLSIIVFPSRLPFVVALRMLPEFFTSFQYHPDPDNYNTYRANIFLHLFITNVSKTYTDDINVTIYLNRRHPLAPIKFQDPRSGYFRYSTLVLANPHNIDISSIDFSVFVAIPSAAFINIIYDFDLPPTEYVCVAVTKTEAKFKSQKHEVTFTPENKDCIIGGVGEEAVYYFMITLAPTCLFYNIAYKTNFVWLFRTVSTRSLLCSCVGLHASYLVCF